MQSNFDILEAIRDDLHDYADPYNSQGFIIPFHEWVIREWFTRLYYITEIANFGYDLTNYPQKTDFLLREKAKTYRDFIHANNGHHYAAFSSGQGTACETLEKNLYEFFHESMRLRAIHFLEENFPNLDSEDFWNRIFCEDFSSKKDLQVTEEISNLFGFYGLAVEPYICHSSDAKDQEGYGFGPWRLEDFHEKLQSLKFDQSTRSKVSDPFMRRSPTIQAEALLGKPFKKNLSQSGAFA
jgi:hypothetical protein